jgi:putative spermidine/putrescine transport system substrate-binding protein
MRHAMSRVQPIGSVLLLLVGLMLAGCGGGEGGSARSGAGRLVVDGNGAEYAKIWMDVVGKPFMAETGIEVEYVGEGTAAEAYTAIRASRGDPGFDLAIMTSWELAQGRKDKLLAPVTAAEVPNLANAYPQLAEAAGGVGAIQDLQQVVLMYDTTKFSKPPTSWNVMWDPAYRRGTLAWHPSNALGVFQLLIAADLAGGDPSNVEPGWRRLEELAPHLLATPSKSAEAVPYMEQGKVSAFPYFDGRAAIYAEQTHYDYTVPKEGTYALLSALGVPSGAENKADAYKLIDFWLRPDVQAKWAQQYRVSPAVRGVQLPADFARRHVSSADDLGVKVKVADAGLINEHRAEWLKRWQRTFG